MDRIIQPYTDPAAGVPARVGAGLEALGGPIKTPGDFARALRRRVGLVLIVALTIGLGGAALVVRMPAVYQATADIEINPPRFDQALSVILDNVAGRDHEAAEMYVPNRIAVLRSKSLAERTVARLGSIGGDPAQELLDGLTVKKVPGTSYYQVFLEGHDPERVAKLLNSVLELFVDKSKDESEAGLEGSKIKARKSLDKLLADLKDHDARIARLINEAPYIAPGGKNLHQEEYLAIKGVLLSKRIRFDDLQQERRIADLYPYLKAPPRERPADRRLGALLEYKERLELQAENHRRIIRNFNSDPAGQRIRRYLENTEFEIARLQALPRNATPDLSEIVLRQSGEELRKLELEVKEQKARMQESMPAYQEYLSLLKQRADKERSIGALEDKIAKFELVSESQTEPVRIEQRAVEPTTPIRPRRTLYIAIVSIIGLVMGVGLVCLLEYLDHSVKVPEQLTAGLTLPLLAVIPRMRRLASIHRGGHLWTPGAPGSIEADAYRNLRASLLGLDTPDRPIVTLLVTSAKAGEGKSTTALNLAATCARAGERTLLLDCDLRRPSLGDVFGVEGPPIGLVDVLKGDLPWQRAVVGTDIPNLDFLPTGDPEGIPIEILGTIELRQLIAALSGHYHRVILDGPAVLGLADCRMLGRVVDAAVLVVRSGAHALLPLRRAKETLEQSKVRLAGVVFNGLNDDLKNWSSYAPNALPYGPGRLTRSPEGLDAPPDLASSAATHDAAQA